MTEPGDAWIEAVCQMVIAIVQNHHANTTRLLQQTVALMNARFLSTNQELQGRLLVAIQLLQQHLVQSHIAVSSSVCMMSEMPPSIVGGRANSGIYIRDRQTCFWKDVMPDIEDSRWCRLFRLPKPLFRELAASLQSKLVTSPPPGLTTIEGRRLGVDKQLAICLNRLACGGQSFMASELFGVSETTVGRLVHKVVEAICEVHGDRLKWPSGEARSRVMAEFEQDKALPNCLGALDCTHIHMEKPANCASEKYYDRNGRFSLIVMAVVDLNYRFLYIHVGCPGPYNDARVFRISALGTRTSTLFAGEAVGVQGRMVKPYVIADAGFALKEHVIVPYQGRDLPAIQKDFNHRHSSARMCVEQTFGIFKEWWGYLGGMIRQPNVQALTAVVRACAIMHNMMREAGVDYDPQLVDRSIPREVVPPVVRDQDGPEEGGATQEALRMAAKEARDALADNVLAVFGPGFHSDV